ncbi:MAG: hypothetical protein JWO06_1099 [Bacteroidota bacterium]|nr:hypothetical protein [Bacteroidota bacterium]
MKNLMKSAVCTLLIICAVRSAEAQELASLSTGGYSNAVAITEKPTAPTTQGTEVAIVIKNSAEKPVIIFAGPKEEIRNPKVHTFGGLSKNTLYLQSNDIVCLMTNEPKIMACTNIKAGSTSIEINSSGNMISCK